MSQSVRQPLAVDTGRQMLIRLGFTITLLGYFMVWLPYKLAGLSFIGLEIGEWVKFLPQIRSGQISADRNLFYLPPITLGLVLALWTAGWPNRRWRTWATRAVAVLVALLALPAVEAVLYEGSDQWLGRLVAVLFVVLVVILLPLLQRLPNGNGLKVAWIATLVIALAGLILPTWAYLTVRPAVVELFADEVGTGPGLWFNGIGHLLVAVGALTWLLEQRGQPVNLAGRRGNKAG
jgi:hypothetical protein